MSLVLTLAYHNVFLIAHLSIHGFRIFVFIINALFMLVLYVYCSPTHAHPINLILGNLERFILPLLIHNCLLWI
jgi:hypothetical protein